MGVHSQSGVKNFDKNGYRYKVKKEFQHFSCVTAHGLKRGVSALGRSSFCLPVTIPIWNHHITIPRLVCALSDLCAYIFWLFSAHVIEIIKHYFNICISSSFKLSNIPISYLWLLEQIDHHRFLSDQWVPLHIFPCSSEFSVSNFPKKAKEVRKWELLLWNYYRPSWNVRCCLYQFFPCYTDQIGAVSTQNMMCHNMTPWHTEYFELRWRRPQEHRFCLLLPSFLWPWIVP